MPSISAITPIKVVVATMIPNRVRKLRSLCPCRENRATFTASTNEPVDLRRAAMLSPKYVG